MFFDNLSFLYELYIKHVSSVSYFLYERTGRSQTNICVANIYFIGHYIWYIYLVQCKFDPFIHIL